MAKLKYKTIDGIDYDISLLKETDKIIKAKGKITEKKAKKIFKSISENDEKRKIQERTLLYIFENFLLSNKAKEYFQEKLNKIDKVTKNPSPKKLGFWRWVILFLLLIFFILLGFIFRNCNSPSQLQTIETENQKLEQQPKITENKQELPQESTIALIESNIFYFQKNNSTLLRKEQNSLKEIALFLKKYKNLNLEIIGHSCSLGDEELNQNISLVRAKNVQKFLIEQGISALRLAVRGEGSKYPLSQEKDENFLAKNRRVELRVIE